MEKKLRKSTLEIVLYVITILLLVYTCYTVGSTIKYIISYSSSYGITPGVGETVGYVLQSVFEPLVFTILVFASARILNEVRALNPAYYTTDEEIQAAKEVKNAAKANVEEMAVEVETEVKEEIKVDASMKKDELLAIADMMGIKVPAKATKADIIAAINEK